MPRAYLIGGAPRAGKSTLAKRFLEQRPVSNISTDALRAQLRQSTTPQANPALFYLDSLNADEAGMARLMQGDTATIIAAAEAESAAVWPAIEDFVERNLLAGRDVLVEGVAVLPHLVAGLKFPYTAVFLGNQARSHAQVIQDYAKRHPDTWLGGLKPDTIAAFAHFCRATSRHLETETNTHKLPYFEMKGDFEAAVKSLHDHLAS